MKVKLGCKTCRKRFQVELGSWNYREAKFCSRPCFWESRRKHRTDAQKKEIKRLYDIEFRKKNRAKIATEKKRAYEQNREKRLQEMKVYRQTPEYRRRMRKYLASYWTPALRKQKAEYDRVYRAKRLFGPFWEAAILTVDLDKEVKSRMSVYEIKLKNNTLNKTLIRSRNGEIKRGYT